MSSTPIEVDRLNGARRVLAEALEVPLDQIAADASIETLEAWDSLGHVKVVMRIEDRIGRTLEAEEIVSLFDIDSVAKLIAAAQPRPEGQ